MEKVAKTGKFPKIADVVVLMLLFLVAQAAVLLLLPLFGVTLPVTSAIDTVPVETYIAEQESLAKYCALYYPLSMLLPILLMWLYLRLRGGKGVIRIHCSAAGLNPSVILVGVLWLLSSQIVLEPLVLMLPKHQSPGVGLGVWAYITTIGFAPILEEILCRGLLFEAFHKRWGVKISILLSALFFGIIHFDPATAVVALFAGLIFGVLYVRTSSIFASMIVHAINNALAFMLITIEKDDVPLREIVGNDKIYYIIYGVAAVIFIAASVEAFFKLRAKKEEPATETTEEVEEVEVSERVEEAAETDVRKVKIEENNEEAEG
jgi:membrane protease YdiL (CAAX protease family)